MLGAARANADDGAPEVDLEAPRRLRDLLRRAQVAGDHPDAGADGARGSLRRGDHR
jgi:hypothetical protein